MTRIVLIALSLLIIAVAAANSEASDSEVVAKAEAEATTEDQNENDDEECYEPDPEDPTTTEAPVTSDTPTLTCGANEVYDDCPAECQTDYCPRSEAEAKSAKACLRPDKCPPPQCKCSFNYRRAENGTCIPTTSCPAFECCGENEVYNSCPPLCPTDDCSQASPSGECPPLFGNILIVLECAPQCRCREGYWRKNGVCVPYEECSVPTCGVNEVLVKCPADCGSEYCPKSEADSAKTKVCSQPKPCPPPACQCRFNHRRAENGTCIPTRDCPPFECSGINEEYNSCPPWCPRDDCSQATPDGTCPKRFGRIGVVLICEPKCRCRKGYWRKNGICVPYDECNTCSGLFEEYTLEKPSCPPQECNSLVARINCTGAPPPQPGCACKSGYMRLNRNSSCVPVCQCPQMKSAAQCQAQSCGENEEYNPKKPSCPPEECFSMVARYDCSKFPPPQPGCACVSGYTRLKKGSPCVPNCQCPQIKNSPECQ